MKKIIKIVLILGGILIGAIAALLAVLSKREKEDDVEYCDYDDLEPYDWESEWPEDFDVDESDEDIL